MLGWADMSDIEIVGVREFNNDRKPDVLLEWRNQGFLYLRARRGPIIPYLLEPYTPDCGPIDEDRWNLTVSTRNSFCAKSVGEWFGFESIWNTLVRYTGGGRTSLLVFDDGGEYFDGRLYVGTMEAVEKYATMLRAREMDKKR